MTEAKFYPTRWLAGMLLGLWALTAHAFSVTDTHGKIHKLEDYKGKWVLVNFWATWCPPCLDEIPDLQSLYEDNRSRLMVIGIALQYPNGSQVISFAKSMNMTYPVVLGNEGIVSQIGPVDGLPTSYLFNPQGKLVAHQTGEVTRKAVEDYINRVSGSAARKKEKK